MKTLSIVLLINSLVFALHAKELSPSEFVFGHPDKTIFMKIINTIKPKTLTKKIFIQNNKIVSWNQVNQDEIYCVFENTRSTDKTILSPIETDTVFKLSNDFFESWEKVLGFRLWQKNFFIWDNGYYQAFDCTALNTPSIFDYATLKSHVGFYFKLYK
jgi:hypothetical protein